MRKIKRKLKKILIFLHLLENPIKKNISIGKNVTISKTAKIETRGGGSIEIGDNCEILDGVLLLTYGGKIAIGKNCTINPYTIIYGHGGTKIGDNVLIAGHCMLIPNHHNYEKKDKLIVDQGCTSKGIKIGNDVWIAHNCTITDGCEIGNGVVLGAGTVAKGILEDYSVHVGVPNKKIKERL